MRTTQHGLDEPPVPNLPGYQATRHQTQQIATALGGTRKGKVATLKYVHNYPVVEESVVPIADKLQLHRYNKLPHHAEAVLEPVPEPVQPRPRPNSSLQWTGVKTPGWLMFDKKVLRFFAFSTDKVLYSPVEEVRYRRFEFRYFMEDSTMQVIEPQEHNSGLPQGTYLQRGKVRLADGSRLSHDMLRIGGEVTIYSRRFVIVGCDAATRRFYAEDLRAPQPQDLPMPAGKYDITKKAEAEAEAERRTRTHVSGAPKAAGSGEDPFEESRGPGAMFEFFEDRKVQEHLDRKLLRFYCCWDNTERVYQEKLGMIIYYFLKDDTIEVAEVHRRNTGRDPYPLLLSRCQLPKTPNIPSVGGRPLSPRSKRNLNIQYYHWTDFRMGTVIKVYGRELLIYDMDVFTRSWMQEQLGLTPAQLQPLAVDFDMGPKRPPMQVPPNTLGIGTDEDSLQNVLYLIPKRPIKDSKHYLENWNKVFRFTARMVPVPGKPLVGPHDAERRFIVSFFLLDNTLSIFEPKQPNNRGGMFLERMKAKKHGQDESFTDQDFQVGGVICVYARHFELLDTDSYTLRHMEANPDRYPCADVEKVHDKIMAGLMDRPQAGQALRQQLYKQDAERQGRLKHGQVKAALDACGIDVTAHEVITLVHHLAGEAEGVGIDQLLHALHLLEAPRTQPAAGVHHGQQYEQRHAHDEHEQLGSLYRPAAQAAEPTGLPAQHSYSDVAHQHDQWDEAHEMQHNSRVAVAPGTHASWQGYQEAAGAGGPWRSQAVPTSHASMQVQPSQQMYLTAGKQHEVYGSVDHVTQHVPPGSDVSAAVAEYGSVRGSGPREPRSARDQAPSGPGSHKVTWQPALAQPAQYQQLHNPLARGPGSGSHSPPHSNMHTGYAMSVASDSPSRTSRDQYPRDQYTREEFAGQGYGEYDHQLHHQLQHYNAQQQQRPGGRVQGYGNQLPVVLQPSHTDEYQTREYQGPGRAEQHKHAPGVKHAPAQAVVLNLPGGNQPVAGSQAYAGGRQGGHQVQLDSSMRKAGSSWTAGKENQASLSNESKVVHVHTAQPELKDMRFVPRPGSGVGPASTSQYQGSHNSLSVQASRPNSSVMDSFTKQHQPSSLWQTTNSASGGVHRMGPAGR